MKKILVTVLTVILIGFNLFDRIESNQRSDSNEDSVRFPNDINESNDINDQSIVKPARAKSLCANLMEKPESWFSASDTLRDICSIYLKVGKENRPKFAYPFNRERKFFALHMNKNNRYLNQDEISNAKGFKYGK